MTAEDVESYVAGLGFTVEVVTGENNTVFTVVRDVPIPAGPRAGMTCDIGLERTAVVPYSVPSAIHTRPALVRMDTGPPWATQKSGLGDDWQYWSRRFDHVPSPQAIWAHILTVLSENVS